MIRDPQRTFTPQALLCTDPAADQAQILEWFVLRWQLEVTFQEIRTHLGVETQRQWSDLAIARTTPILLGLFSWATLVIALTAAVACSGATPSREESKMTKESKTTQDQRPPAQQSARIPQKDEH